MTTTPHVLIPESTIEFALLLISEITIGLSIGLTIKILQTALNVMGSIFSYQAGLANGTLFDPTYGGQTNIPSNFLTLTFTVLLMSYNIHLEIIKTIVDSYQSFSIGFFNTHYHNFIDLIIRVSSDAFNIGTRLAIPFLVIGILTNLSAGILSRLMPQMQVFFILMPAQILIHALIFLITLSGALLWFIDYYQQYLSHIFP